MKGVQEEGGAFVPPSHDAAFGGKSRIASYVWQRLGDVDNFIEPFANSAAVLLARPHPAQIETLNDMDCYIANFWRATKHEPRTVVEYADWPVNEADLHARHKWLVLSPAAAEFRQRMRTDPHYYDPKVAGWWVWGACCWIGAGWCVNPELAECEQQPYVGVGEGRGVNASRGKRGPAGGSGERRPQISGQRQTGQGVHAKGHSRKRPVISNDESSYGHGMHGPPQLADTYSRGRGVHNDNHLSQQMPLLRGNGDVGDGVTRGTWGTCAERRAWLLDWFGRLRDRLRTVRVCCGDWLRVCDSESVTTKLGLTGIFFDPPYSAEAGRSEDLYAHDSATVAHDVRRYCLERGSDPQMRIVLAGYAGEGHEELEAHGWEIVAWKAQGGYGNRSEKGKANARKERLWVSPHCERGEQSELF